MAGQFNLRMRTAGLQGTGNSLGSGLASGGSGKRFTRKAMGMHIGNLAPTTVWGEISASANNTYNQVPIPDIGIGAMRLWDSNGCSWRNIEKTPGVYSWSRLDNAVNLCREKGIEIILNLGHGPDFATTQQGQTFYQFGIPNLWVGYNPFPPANNQIWINWCTAIATRYAGLGIVYEIWNEVNDQHFGTEVAGSGYMGSIASLVTLTQLARQTILAIDPTAKIMSPNFVGEAGIQSAQEGAVTLDGFLAAGGAQYCDIISIHGYNTLPIWTRPEGMIGMAKLVKDTMAKYNVTKPLWNTEWGYGLWRDQDGGFMRYPGNQMPDDIATQYVTRMLILSWVGGFERFYFYSIDGVQSYNSIVMINPTSFQAARTTLAAANAYMYFSDTLNNGYLSDLQEVTGPGNKLYYKVSFTLVNGRKGYIYWCDNYTSIVLSLTNAKSCTDNLGNVVDITSGNVTITGNPKFVYY